MNAVSRPKARRAISLVGSLALAVSLLTANVGAVALDSPASGWHTVERASVSSSGTQADAGSGVPAVSADGQFVAFVSSASNLVPGDTNGRTDVFVHDRETGTTERVSIASDGTQGDSGSSWPAISSEGRFVAFQSSASNLVPGDTNGRTDVFVHDRETGTTERVSVASGGTQVTDGGYEPSISADGRFVLFKSFSSSLVSGDTNGGLDVFVHDRDTNTTERVSIANDGAQGNSHSGAGRPVISASGRYAAFSSSASNLVTGDTNGARDVFVRDRDTGTTERVSVASDGTQGEGFSGGGALAISAGGRFVAFTSRAENLVPGDANGWSDLFVHDRDTATTERVAAGSGAVIAMSADGQQIAFDSTLSNLVAGDTNGVRDVFVNNRDTGTTERVSVAGDGTQAVGASCCGVAVSADGEFIAFDSGAPNLVAGDTNGRTDVFVATRGSAHAEDQDGDLIPDSIDVCLQTGPFEIPDDRGCSRNDLIAALQSFASDVEANLLLGTDSGARALVYAALVDDECGPACEGARALLFSISQGISFASAVDSVNTFFTPAGSAGVFTDVDRLSRVINRLERARTPLEIAGIVSTLQGLVDSFHSYRLFPITLGELGDEVVQVYHEQGPVAAMEWAEYRLSFSNPVPIPQRSGVTPPEGNRPLACSSDWANGTGTVRRNIARTYAKAIDAIPAVIESDFPSAELVLEARRLATALEDARTRDEPTTVTFTARPDGTSMVERTVTLGSTHQMGRAADALLTAWEQNRKVDQIASASQGALALYGVVSYQIGGGTTSVAVTKGITDLLVSAVALEVDQVVLHRESVDASESLHFLATSAAWDVSAEATGIWALSDALVSSVLHASGVDTPICLFGAES